MLSNEMPPFLNKSLLFLMMLLLFVLVALSPIIALGYVMGVSLVIVFFLRPQYIIYSFLIYFPLEETVLRYMPDGIASMLRFSIEPILMFLLGVVIIRNVITRKKIRVSYVMGIVLVFLGISLVSNLLNSSNLTVWLLGIRPFIRYISLFLIIINIQEISYKRVFYLICSIMFIEGVLGLLQYAFPSIMPYFAAGDTTIGGKLLRSSYQTNYTDTFIFGTLGRYNIYANFLTHILLIIIPYRIYILKAESAYRVRLIDILILLGLISLVLSNSRASTISLILSCSFVFFFVKIKLRKLVPLLVSVLLISIVIIIRLEFHSEGDNLLYRFTNAFSSDYIQQSLETDRLYVLFYLLPYVLKTKFLFGYGPGEVGSDLTGSVVGSSQVVNIKPVFDNPFISDVGHVSMIAQIGLMGYGCYIFLYAYIYRKAKFLKDRIEDNYKKAICVGLMLNILAVFIENFFSFNVIYRPISGYLWIMFGLVIKIYYEYQEKESVEREKNNDC